MEYWFLAGFVQLLVVYFLTRKLAIYSIVLLIFAGFGKLSRQDRKFKKFIRGIWLTAILLISGVICLLIGIIQLLQTLI